MEAPTISATISYGEGAHDAFRRTIEDLPLGYAVALTVDGEEPRDGELRKVDDDGVTIALIVDDGLGLGNVAADLYTADWEDLAGVHIY